jgi:membrane protein
VSTFTDFRLKETLNHVLWDTNINRLPKAKALLLTSARIVVAVGRDIAGGQLTLRATSLVFTTLLSLVPLLALSFSMLKAFGVHNQLEPALIGLLEPLGEKGGELAQQLVQFVENVGVGVLGSVGLVVLIYTVVSLIQKIEGAFNFIWRVSSLRPLIQRVSSYLSVVLLGPMLVFAAVGITATVLRSTMVQELLMVAPLGTLYYGFSKLLPYLLVSGAFTLTYLIIPNTHVRITSALLGGAVAGILWETGNWGFTSFIVNSTKYTAIYSSFAIIILFLIWIYLSWMIMLLGASIAFYHQNPAYRHPNATVIGQRSREALALEILRRVNLTHRGDTSRWTQQSLTDAVQLPLEQISHVLTPLMYAGLLVYTDDRPAHIVPGRDLETVSIKNVLDVMSGCTEASDSLAFAHQRVQTIMQQIDDTVAHGPGTQTVKDLLDTENSTPPS